MHSVPFLRFLESSSISTSIGQTFRHLLQEMHFVWSQVIRTGEKWLMGFRNTVIGQMYLQKARLSLKANASAMPRA